MARAFRRKGARVVARLDEVERAVVSMLMEQTRDVLAPLDGSPEAAAQSGDPFDEMVASIGMPATPDAGAVVPMADELRDAALDRLLPSANREDPSAAAEFRRLTEQGLRERKTANLTVAIDALAAASAASAKDRVDLDVQQAQAVLVALVDVRLLLGERLGLRSDEDADELERDLSGAAADDPRVALVAYYDFLTWLQESLTQSLMRR